MTTSIRSATRHPPASMTWARWRLLLLLMAICFLAHFNRISMSVAADLRIMEQYDISPTQMGLVYSAFLATYTLFMVPAGWLIDRRGTRFSLGLVCFGSAIFVALTGSVGLATSSTAVAFGSLLVIRSLMGIVSAPLHPAAAKAASLGIPAARRSWANGMVTGAALLGVTATYVLFSRLVDVERLNWPGAFFAAALATAAVGWLWMRWAVDDEPAVALTSVHTSALPPEWTFRTLLRGNKNLLLLTASYGAAGYLQYLFFYWMHYYFEKVLHLDEPRSRLYSAAATLSMAAGMALGGWLSDRVEVLFGWRAARSGMAVVSMSASAGLVLLGISATEPFWIATWLALSMGALGLVEGPFWATAVEVGRRRGGLSASVLNTGGNAGGFLAPFVTPWLSNALGWKVGIAAGSLVCLAGAILWCWIDATPKPDGAETQDSRYP